MRVLEKGRAETRMPWPQVEEVHIEPASAGDDDPPRWLINLLARDGTRIRIDSVNVRGAGDFEHKTEEFLGVLEAIHQALSPRAGEVRFLFGMRRGVTTLWRIALLLCLAAGLFGLVAAIGSGEWEAAAGALAFIGIGLSGLKLLHGRNGPRPYEPTGFTLEAKDKPADRQ